MRAGARGPVRLRPSHGVLDHFTKEVEEVPAYPTDFGEWEDLIILALDCARRLGVEAHAIIDAVVSKQARNEARTWPDRRTADRDKAIEHDRTGEGVREPPTEPNRTSAAPRPGSAVRPHS